MMVEFKYEYDERNVQLMITTKNRHSDTVCWPGEMYVFGGVDCLMYVSTNTYMSVDDSGRIRLWKV